MSGFAYAAQAMADRGRGGGEGVRTRDHLANVRTLLAWQRTGLLLLALAVVVDRLEALRRGGGGVANRNTDRPAAVALAVLGTAICCGGLARFEQARRAIERAHWQARVGPDLILLGLAGVAAAVLVVALARM